MTLFILFDLVCLFLRIYPTEVEILIRKEENQFWAQASRESTCPITPRPLLENRETLIMGYHKYQFRSAQGTNPWGPPPTYVTLGFLCLFLFSCPLPPSCCTQSRCLGPAPGSCPWREHRKAFGLDQLKSVGELWSGNIAGSGTELCK